MQTSMFEFAYPQYLVCVWSLTCCRKGGGERALFEARACGAQVEVADDNSKLQVCAAMCVVPKIVPINQCSFQSLLLEPIPDHELYYVQVSIHKKLLWHMLAASLRYADINLFFPPASRRHH